jgi:hypothetical protein
LDRFVEANPDEYSTLVEAKKKKLAQEDHWKRILAGKQDILQRAAERQVRTDLLGRVGMMNFDTFRQQRSREGEQQIIRSVNPGKSMSTELSQMPAGHVPESPNG